MNGSGAVLDWDELVDQAVAIRKEEKISQRDLAALAGVTAPTVIKFEQKRTTIRVESALAILAVLGLAGRRTPTRGLVDELAELYSEGVREIWNRPVKSDADREALDAFDRDWQRRIRTVLRRGFPHTELVLFSRLGVVPDIVRDPTFNAKHAKILREYAVREGRLRDILRRYSGPVLDSPLNG